MSYRCLRGKTFIVTGAASGMGRTTALGLARQGANVGLLDLRKPDGVLAEIEQLEEKGKAFSVACDVSDRHAVDAAVKQVTERFGSLHGAANMAGYVGNQGLRGTGHGLDVLKDEDWDDVVKVNLDGVRNCLRAQVNNMKDGGSIVNAGSIQGQRAFPYMAPYGVSKWGVLGLTKIAAQEFGQKGIRVNAVAPISGVIRTPMTLGLGNDQELYDAMGSRTALKRLAEPEEVSNVILFLLSEQASYITAAVINVDAGYD